MLTTVTVCECRNADIRMLVDHVLKVLMTHIGYRRLGFYILGNGGFEALLV